MSPLFKKKGKDIPANDDAAANAAANVNSAEESNEEADYQPGYQGGFPAGYHTGFPAGYHADFHDETPDEGYQSGFMGGGYSQGGYAKPASAPNPAPAQNAAPKPNSAPAAAPNPAPAQNAAPKPNPAPAAAPNPAPAQNAAPKSNPAPAAAPNSAPAQNAAPNPAPAKEEAAEPAPVKEEAAESAPVEEEAYEVPAEPNEPMTPESYAKARTEAADFKRKWYAVTAEYENYRKRTKQTKIDSYAEGRADIVKKLFPIGDNLERALTSCNDEKTKKGIEMVLNAYNKILSEELIEVINPAGQEFNPHECEAIMAVEVENPEEKGFVKEVYLKGYVQNGKVLRYAQVVVTK